MRDIDYTPTVDFLAAFFGPTTEHNVELRALPNERGAGPAKPLFTREPDLVQAHCRKWDDTGRAVYFGVCTRLLGSHTGARADVAECPAVWSEVDTRKLGLGKHLVRSAAMTLPFPPSIVIDSGGGLHFYWMLSEALDVRADAPDAASTEEAVVAVLRQLAGVLAGDTSVCDLARIMRLPGTHNTKPEVMAAHSRGPVPVTVLDASWARYEFSDLVEWLDWQRPVVERPAATVPDAAATAENPFTAFARAAAAVGLKPPLDVEQALAAMVYGGDGDSGIHQTQLRVSAALVAQGREEDEIVDLLLAATRAAAGPHATTWNWRREERALRQMIASAQAKGFADRARPTAGPTSGSTKGPTQGTPGIEDRPHADPATPVIDLAAERVRRAAKPEKEKDDKAAIIRRLGEATINWWQDHRGPLIVVAGDPWTYRDGVWRLFDAGLHHTLRVAIQGVVEAAGIAPTTGLLNAVHRYVIERPALMREEVEWDRSGTVVGRNGAIDPNTGAIVPHSPDLHATFRIEADLDPAARCPRWIAMLGSALGNLPERERVACIDTLAEVFGSFLVRGKRRELTKALFVIGPSRTGKTQVAEVARALVGGRTCGMRAASLNENFGVQPLIGASAWIADDAVRTGEFLDAEWFKVLVEGALVSVPRKNLHDWHGRFDMPVLLTANHLPRVKDQSDAVYNRTLILPLTVIREETADNLKIGEIIAQEELGGVVNWAIDGWRRLCARGHFAPPDLMTKALRDFKQANAPIAAWLAVAVESDPLTMVDRRDLIASFNGWYAMEYGSEARPVGARALIPAVRSALPLVGDHRTARARFATGLRLTEEGIGCLEYLQDNSYGKVVGSGAAGPSINAPAPQAGPRGDATAQGAAATAGSRRRAVFTE